jgi:hypothetical protein
MHQPRRIRPALAALNRALPSFHARAASFHAQSGFSYAIVLPFDFSFASLAHGAPLSPQHWDWALHLLHRIDKPYRAACAAYAAADFAGPGVQNLPSKLCTGRASSQKTEPIFALPRRSSRLT